MPDPASPSPPGLLPPPEFEALLAAWRAEERDQPEGWDFSSLATRMREPDLPWDLDDLSREHLARAGSVLDMGTGGGERLLALADALPPDTVATEGWPPNVAVAREALTPHGVEVVEFGQPDDDETPAPMPFPDGRFDLVLNRHESYHPREITRILARGGRFLTQQVGGNELTEVREALAHPPTLPQVRYDLFRAGLSAAGLTVLDGAESVDHYEFADVAALVAYLQLVPWDAPEDLTVDRYADALLGLHASAAGRPLRATRIRFWLLATKP